MFNTNKLPEMIDVKSPRCQHDGCSTRAGYSIEGQKEGKYCGEHKLPEVIDVSNPRCQHDGCMKQPNYNIEGQKIGKYCVGKRMMIKYMKSEMIKNGRNDYLP